MTSPRTPARRKGPVEVAVEKELKALPAELKGSAVAATALAMARELDNARNSATSKSMCASRLLDAMEALRKRVPERPAASKLDEIAQRREKRLARRSGS